MKYLITIPLVWLTSHITLAQNSYQQTLINDINVMTEEINFEPERLYAERSQAIYKLNITRAQQTWVPYTLTDAINDINCAIELNPDDAHLYSLRAEYKRNIHIDYSGAIKDMSTAISLEPDNPKWYMQRANYRKLEKGCVDYQQCADMQDKTCQAIVREACTELLSSRF